MLQGTGSDVGKSLLVTGLCRAFAGRGLRVRPFKPQTMSNNAAVAGDGGEIGRAQALQARAAGIEPSVHMNPVLLKPQADAGAQLVVQGRVEGTAEARAYHALKPALLPRVLDSFRRLSEDADLVLVEGAGSPAEINLRAGDIANMGFAEAAGVPVVLVADIDRGGALASIVGTHALLCPGERNLLRGYIINKFRGDPSLFDGAVVPLRERTGLDCLGVVPFLAEARVLPKEDAMALDTAPPRALPCSDSHRPPESPMRIAVPRLPRIANFDDLDPLSAEPDVAVTVVEAGDALPGDADLVLLPGSKATLADLGYVGDQGWDVDILAHRRRGGRVVGLCGGYQMLGRVVRDPAGLEGPPGARPGLGLLDVETEIVLDKRLARVTGRECRSGQPVVGYEMHMGRTEGPDRVRPWLVLDDGRPEGASSADGLVTGTYVHGIFAADAFRHAFLSRLRQGRAPGAVYEARVEETLDTLARHLDAHLDLDRLLAVAATVASD